MLVIVAGSGILSEISDEQKGAAHAHGVMLAENGFGLISGGWEGVDDIVTAAFIERRIDRGLSPDESLIQVIERGWEPLHRHGKIIYVDGEEN